MHSFNFKSALLALSLGAAVNAHTTFTTLFVDGTNQGDGVCVRMNNNAEQAGFPIEPLTNKAIACGYNGENGVARVCPAKASSTLTFEYREFADGSQGVPLDSGHKGPCAVYMKKVDDATASNNAAGDGWFKIWESSYDEAAGKWCTEKMIENNGHLSVTIPEDIQGGYYLVRPELLALHAAADSPPDPQFYVGCAQIFVESAGTAQPATVNIGEGTYDLSMAGMTYNIYTTPLSLPYPMYGPPVYSAGSGSSPGVSTTSTAAPSTTAPATPETTAAEPTGTTDAQPEATETTASGVDPDATSAATASAEVSTAAVPANTKTPSSPSNGDDGDDNGDNNGEDDNDDDDDDDDDTICVPDWVLDEEDQHTYERRAALTQTTGLKPEGCILVRDNWCAFEVPSYTDETGCWAASKNCWSQVDQCWNTAPPTGGANCKVLEDKCNALDDSCNAKVFTGPPNAGKDLTPTPVAITGSIKVFTRDLPRKDEVVRRQLRGGRTAKFQ